MCVFCFQPACLLWLEGLHDEADAAVRMSLIALALSDFEELRQ